MYLVVIGINRPRGQLPVRLIVHNAGRIERDWSDGGLSTPYMNHVPCPAHQFHHAVSWLGHLP